MTVSRLPKGVIVVDSSQIPFHSSQTCSRNNSKAQNITSQRVMQNSKPVPCIKIGSLFENRSVLGCSSGLGSSGGMGQVVGSVLGMSDLAEVLLFVLHLHRSSGSLSRYLLDGFVSIEQGRNLL
jgi:hypothetical protein